MSADPRRKGRRGEQEVVRLARRAGFKEAHRTAPMQSARQPVSYSDVAGLPCLLEVKRYKQTPVNRLARELLKGKGTGCTRVIAWRDNGQVWRATLNLSDLFKLLKGAE